MLTVVVEVSCTGPGACEYDAGLAQLLEEGGHAGRDSGGPGRPGSRLGMAVRVLGVIGAVPIPESTFGAGTIIDIPGPRGAADPAGSGPAWPMIRVWVSPLQSMASFCGLAGSTATGSVLPGVIMPSATKGITSRCSTT